MTNKTDNCVAEPQEQPMMNIEAKDSITLGLLANYKDSDETRFFLTPEACAVLSSKGFAIKMGSKAAINIH